MFSIAQYWSMLFELNWSLWSQMQWHAVRIGWGMLWGKKMRCWMESSIIFLFQINLLQVGMFLHLAISLVYKTRLKSTRPWLACSCISHSPWHCIRLQKHRPPVPLYYLNGVYLTTSKFPHIFDMHIERQIAKLPLTITVWAALTICFLWIENRHIIMTLFFMSFYCDI